jgi:hypothetical protein
VPVRSSPAAHEQLARRLRDVLNLPRTPSGLSPTPKSTHLNVFPSIVFQERVAPFPQLYYEVRCFKKPLPGII